MTTPDPVTLSVLDNRFRAIVEEMGEAMLRTAYSQILNSCRDFSIALCDAQARLVAQADHIPIHVGAMPFAAQAVRRRLRRHDAQGDVFLLNDPYHGGSHLPDLTIIVPVFADGAAAVLVGRARAPDRHRRRHAWRLQPRRDRDLAGRAAHAADPARRRGACCATTWCAMIVAQHAPAARFPRRPDGDDRRGASGREAAARALLAKHGAALAEAAAAGILALSEAHARRIIAAWADGT